MRRNPPSRKLTGWLALLALCLVIVAPVVSRLVAAGHASAHAAADIGTMAGMPGHDTMPGHPRPHHPGLLDECGYCELLASHPFVSTTAPPTPQPLPASRWQAPSPQAVRVALDRPRSGAPRGPPRPACA